MSFRKYGGLNYAKSNNIVHNHIANSDVLGVSDHVGATGTQITCESKLIVTNDITCENLTVHDKTITEYIDGPSGVLKTDSQLDINGDIRFEYLGNNPPNPKRLIFSDGSSQVTSISTTDTYWQPLWNGGVIGATGTQPDAIYFPNQVIVGTDPTGILTADPNVNFAVKGKAGILGNFYVGTTGPTGATGVVFAPKFSVDSDGNMGVSGGATFYNNVGIKGTLDVTGGATFNNVGIKGTLGVSGTSTLTGAVNGITTIGTKGLYGTVIVGSGPYTSLTGTNNTLVGSNTGNALTTSGNNAFLGQNIANNATTGNDNTAIGNASCKDLTTGKRNACLGLQAGETITTQSNNTCLGYKATVSVGVNRSTALGVDSLCATSDTIQLGTIGQNVNCPATLSVVGALTLSNNLTFNSTDDGKRQLISTYYNLHDNTAVAGGSYQGRIYSTPSVTYLELGSTEQTFINMIDAKIVFETSYTQMQCNVPLTITTESLAPNPSLTISDSTNSTSIKFIPYSTGGQYNPMNVSGDNMIFSDNSTSLSSLLLTTHSETSCGIRIRSNGIDINGNTTLNQPTTLTVSTYNSYMVGSMKLIDSLITVFKSPGGDFYKAFLNGFSKNTSSNDNVSYNDSDGRFTFNKSGIYKVEVSVKMWYHSGDTDNFPFNITVTGLSQIKMFMLISNSWSAKDAGLSYNDNGTMTNTGTYVNGTALLKFFGYENDDYSVSNSNYTLSFYVNANVSDSFILTTVANYFAISYVVFKIESNNLFT